MRPQKITSTLLGLTLISSLCVPPFSMRAENEAPQRLILLQKTGTRLKPLRPKAPDRQVITCAYDGESLLLSFVIPEGTATLSVSDETLITSTFEFDTSPLAVSVPVGELVGTVTIEMETESGNSYQGQIE